MLASIDEDAGYTVVNDDGARHCGFAFRYCRGPRLIALAVHVFCTHQLGAVVTGKASGGTHVSVRAVNCPASDSGDFWALLWLVGVAFRATFKDTLDDCRDVIALAHTTPV